MDLDNVNTEPWTSYLNAGLDACYNLYSKISLKSTLNPGLDACYNLYSKISLKCTLNPEPDAWTLDLTLVTTYV